MGLWCFLQLENALKFVGLIQIVLLLFVDKTIITTRCIYLFCLSLLSVWFLLPKREHILKKIFKKKIEKEILKDLFCHQCQLQFNGKSVYNLHLSLVHKHDSDIKDEENQKNSSFEFDKCDEKFGINNKLNDVTTVLEGKKVFECDICSITFARKSSLTTHLATVHEGKKPFKCEICSATFSTKSNLKTHSATVHEGKKPFKCDICENNFPTMVT